MPTIVHIDVETFSKVSLKNVGAYRYARDPSTECLIFCYAVNDSQVYTWLPWKNQPPKMLVDFVRQGAIFMAHNAEFERQIWTHVLAKHLPAPARKQWRCTAVQAAAAGLPRSLDGALLALGGPTKKDPRGKKLIRVFCSPRKPTKRNAAIRILPTDQPADFQEFIAYCQQDVVGERELAHKLPEPRPEEWRDYHYNMLINDRGLPLDIPSIYASAKVVADLEKRNTARVNELTGGLRATQRDKMLAWLKANASDLDDMKLKSIVNTLKTAMPANMREVLELRLEASKASTKKIKKMAEVACEDYHARGTMLFYGAHTGRWSGKLIQPHNFTRGLLEPEEQINVLEAFKTGDVWMVDCLYDKPMHMLSQSMRGFIRAPKGTRFLIADYSMIETRVLAWLANEHKLLRIYHENLKLPKEKQTDVYKLMATILYGVEYIAVTKEQRRIGKNLRLGAGYQLGVDGLLKNCEKEEIEMEREFAEDAIRIYRADNKNIVQLWYDIEDAALTAMRGRRTVIQNKVQFERWRDWFTIILPSGRKLYYFKPEIKIVVKWHKPKQILTYHGEARKVGTYIGVPGRVGTYGGKLVENIVQAIAYDLMINGMIEAEKIEYPSLACIHDEIVTLRKNGEGEIQELEKVICTLPAWAKGLPLVAEGFECERYRKG